MKKLTLSYIILLIVGGIIGVLLVTQKPRYVVTLTGAASPDSLRVYEQRVNGLQVELDSLKAVLGRRGAPGRLAVRLRVAQVEQELSALRAAEQIWSAGHDQYGVGQAYRECVLLYGSVQSACQALSYDTLPAQADTITSQ